MEVKMEAGVPPELSLGSDEESDSETRSISELISELRTAFRTADFDRVEEYLVAREDRLKKRMKIMEEKLEFERLKDLKADMELAQLRDKNIEMDSLKMRAEAEVVVWKRKFEDLESRVTNLEADTLQILNMCPSVEHGRLATGSPPSPSTFGGNKSLPRTGDGKFTSGQTILIIDSDDDMETSARGLKRKRLFPNSETNQHQELVVAPNISPVINSSSKIIPSATTDVEKLSTPSKNDHVVSSQHQEKTGAAERSSQDHIKKFLGDGFHDFKYDISSSSSDSDSDIELDAAILCSKRSN